MFTKLAKQQAVLKANEIDDLDDETYYEPFSYFHLGSLAYIGNSYVPVLSCCTPYSTNLLYCCSNE
jgi:NADH dehydrogenase FAD-containing subunit